MPRKSSGNYPPNCNGIAQAVKDEAGWMSCWSLVYLSVRVRQEMGDVADYARTVAGILSDRALGNDVIAVNIISLEINRHYPAIPQEQRRELAAQVVKEERQRRKGNQNGKT